MRRFDMDGTTVNALALVAGLVLVVMALTGTVLARLPLTASILYLAIGFAVGPAGVRLIDPDPVVRADVLERLTEAAVIVTLFSTGLKLRSPLSSGRWRLPVRLATVSMVITVGLVAAAGMIGLGLSLGAAVLLGAILAPTDPVLAGEVQVEDAWDRDRLRFGLTGEAGLNDGTALPLVMLGLGLLGLHQLGAGGWRWLTIDVLWAMAGGLAIGGLLGTLVGELVLYLRRVHKEAVGRDEFLALGLTALAFGVASLAGAGGVLAVFAAGVALRRIERRASDDTSADAVQSLSVTAGAEHEVATDPRTAPAYMAREVLSFNEQLERISEVAMMVLLGAMLATIAPPRAALWFVPLLLLVVRPVAVLVGLLGAATRETQRPLMAWFGIRGVGTLYYLLFAIGRGLPADLAEQLTALTLTAVAASVVIHGISVTPLMTAYSARIHARGGGDADRQGKLVAAGRDSERSMDS